MIQLDDKRGERRVRSSKDLLNSSLNHLSHCSMNKFFVLILLLIAQLSYAESTDVDSIVVNIGKRKRIVLWGETKDDLRALEKYDLNRIVVQMNQDLDEMPSNVRRSFRQDYEGNSYTKETSLQRQLEAMTSWQRLKRNTYLNFSVGLNSANYLTVSTITYNPFKMTEQLFRQNFLTSPSISIALMRQESFTRTGHKEIVLRYGFDVSWYRLHSMSTKRNSYLLRLNSLDNTKYDTVAVYRPAKSGDNYYTVENLKSGSSINNPQLEQAGFAPYTANQTLLYTDFKIVPSINFYGQNNEKTFHFGIGAYIGMLLQGSRNYKEIKSLNRQETKISIKNKENPYRYGIILNFGYGIVNVFMEADVKNVFINSFDRSSATQNITTIGLRFGR